MVFPTGFRAIACVAFFGSLIAVDCRREQYQQNWQPWSAWSACSGGIGINPACAQKTDFLIIQDVSGSIGGPDLEKAKTFLADLVTVFSAQDRIAFMEFSDGTKMYFDFTVFANPNTNISAVQESIKKFTRSWSGGTAIGNALSKARSTAFVPGAGDRADVTNMVLTVTDGQDGSSSVKAYAEELRSLGVVTLSLGIGSGVNEDQLEIIAGNRSRMFVAKDFDALTKELKEQISSQTCPGFVKNAATQARRRQCSTYTGCQGDAVESRPCGANPSQHCNQWSPWSNCVNGEKISRTRRCRTGGYASNVETDEKRCN